jgi:Ser/Thr protein kinase RdoA (MazF antagonist)
MELSKVLQLFGFGEEVRVEPYGSGLINHTWRLHRQQHQYILQKINDKVFRNPSAIADNMDMLSEYLQLQYPHYFFVSPLPATDGRKLVQIQNGFYRLFPFVKGSHAHDVVETPELAYEAARQFGRFTRLLSGFEARNLHTTIPGFHNLSLRFEQFKAALQMAQKERLLLATKAIEKVYSYAYILDKYQQILKSDQFKLRVTHHDTKISNVLFDSNGKGICVIDLDTVMPGYFFSDLGDMMRTYLSPVSEEEKNFSLIEIRPAFYKAILQGYFEEMQPELTAAETDDLFFSGTFMIYMQAVRFLTDFLQNDTYYGAAYENHNLFRAENQLVLLDRLVEAQPILYTIQPDPTPVISLV